MPEILDYTTAGIKRTAWFKEFLERIRKGDMPNLIGLNFSIDEYYTLSIELGKIEKQDWHRRFLISVEDRIR